MVDVAFWPNISDLRVASFRIRTLRVINELKNFGIDAGIFSKGMKPQTLVVSKRYDECTFDLCSELVSSGTRLIVDLCDNHFYFSDNGGGLLLRANALKKLCKISDAVVVPSSYLKSVVLNEVGVGTKVFIIDDFVNNDGILDSGLGILTKIRLGGYKRQVKSFGTPLTKLIWYGNHGSPGVSGGMEDILLINEQLNNLSKNENLLLTIVSNNKSKYKEVTNRLNVNSIYFEWDPISIKEIMLMQDVCIVPAGLNPFTKSKSSNRATYALRFGVPVVSDEIPSYVDNSDLGIYCGNLVKDLVGIVRKAQESEVDFDCKAFDRNVFESWIKVLG
jgi:hypothetical protein